MQNSSVLIDLLSKYERTKQPISVNFREMLPGMSNSDRSTHLLHPYPAKLLMHIPYFFVSNSYLSNRGDVVLDPFAGSGTTLLEAALAGRKPIGADANPFARLLSKVKITPIASDTLQRAIECFYKSIEKVSLSEIPDVVNLEYWFYPQVTSQLRNIYSAIEKMKDDDVRDFLKICFSNCMRKVSLADPRISVPVRLKADKYPEHHPMRSKAYTHLERLKTTSVLENLQVIISRNIVRLKTIEQFNNKGVAPNIITHNARNLTGTQECFNSEPIKKKSVQLIVTSPPYPGAQKYIRSCGLSLGWLNLCASKDIIKNKREIIGREEVRKTEYSNIQLTNIRNADRVLKAIFEINKKRAAIASYYLIEMREALSEMFSVLKPGGFLVLIAANNNIAGIKFRTVDYLETIAKELGFELLLKLIDDIHSRGLMTKRNKTANIITREWVLVFQKRI